MKVFDRDDYFLPVEQLVWARTGASGVCIEAQGAAYIEAWLKQGGVRNQINNTSINRLSDLISL